MAPDHDHLERHRVRALRRRAAHHADVARRLRRPAVRHQAPHRVERSVSRSGHDRACRPAQPASDAGRGGEPVPRGAGGVSAVTRRSGRCRPAARRLSHGRERLRSTSRCRSPSPRSDVEVVPQVEVRGARGHGLGARRAVGCVLQVDPTLGPHGARFATASRTRAGARDRRGSVGEDAQDSSIGRASEKPTASKSRS